MKPINQATVLEATATQAIKKEGRIGVDGLLCSRQLVKTRDACENVVTMMLFDNTVGGNKKHSCPISQSRYLESTNLLYGAYCEHNVIQ